MQRKSGLLIVPVLLIAFILLIAGCTTTPPPVTPTPTATVPVPTTSTPALPPATGMLTLLISDDENAIGDFSQLVVNLSAVRIHQPGNGSVYTEVPLHEAVDLTTVTGNRTIDVLDINLTPGMYTKIELDVARINGTVNGSSVDVNVPSNRLEIVREFTIAAGQTTTFIFDISVVREGMSNRYNLLPVIAKSGIVGKDVGDPEMVTLP